MKTPVIEARDIWKSFHEGEEELNVLTGANLTLERGEIVCLQGPSGSGKSTLLSILGCILVPSRGTVAIESRVVDPQRLDLLPQIRKNAIGFVFQQFLLFGALTALENVEYALNIKGIRGQAARRDAERLIEAVALADRRNALPRDLSGGQKQRVAIARALAGASPIILADEPTANLDWHTGEQILALFQQLARQEQRAVLVVTHDPRVSAIADRVVEIRDGRLHAAGTSTPL